MRRASIATLAATLLLALTAGSAHASTYAVTSTAEGGDDTPGDDLCVSAAAGGLCTLRAALEEAAAHAGDDDVTVPAGTYTVTSTLVHPASAQGETTVRGEGARTTTISGGSAVAVISNLAAAPNGLTISDLTIADGTASGASDAAGLTNTGSASLLRVLLRDHGGTGPATAVLNDGAGSADAELSLSDVLISGNSGPGHAILTRSSSTAAAATTLINTTVSGNHYSGPSGGSAIAAETGNPVDPTATVNVRHATITGNTASGSGDGALLADSSNEVLNVRNSVLASNDGGACTSGTFVVNSGGNVVDDAAAQVSCGISATSDTLTSNAGLLPLANSGGPTDTHALGAGSPAINRADQAMCGLADARGVARPQGGGCDAGAHEAQPDLTVAIGDSPDPVPAGQTLTYSFTVENVGVAPAIGVVLVAALPDGVAYLAGSSGCSVTGTCTIGTIGAFERKTVVITAQATGPGYVTATATVTTPDLETNLDNNDASSSTTITAPPPPPPPAPTTKGGCTIRGTSGPDRLRGTSGPDRICGFGGNDVLIGVGGGDILIGGGGKDRLIGGGGNDILKGGGGRDTLKGGRGIDDLRGGRGRDILDGGPGRDRLNGGAGRDVARAPGKDRLRSVERRLSGVGRATS